MFARIALLVLRKDVSIEVRSLEVVSTTLFFAVSCVLVFAFALVREGSVVADAAAGILWISIAFSGTLALGRTFERERYAETLRALLLAPAPRPAIYVGKLLGIVLLMAVAEALLVPLVALLFSAPLLGRPALLGDTPDEAVAVMWMSLLAAFDVVFITLGLWTFEPLMTE